MLSPKVEFSKEECLDTQKCIACDYCEEWFHIQCQCIPDEDYRRLQSLSDCLWFCKEHKEKVEWLIQKDKTEADSLAEVNRKLDAIASDLQEIKQKNTPQISNAEML